jgi:hypothetical protein
LWDFSDPAKPHRHTQHDRRRASIIAVITAGASPVALLVNLHPGRREYVEISRCPDTIVL